MRYCTWIAVIAALAAGCSRGSTLVTEHYQLGGHSFHAPENVAVNATEDSLAIYMRASDFELLDRDADGERLFVQIQDGRQPDITAAISALKRYGGVPGNEVHEGLTPIIGGGGDGQYFNQHRYGGVSIFCPPDGWECRARVPYRDLSISIRFPHLLLPGWRRLLDGVLRKVETMEVESRSVSNSVPSSRTSEHP